MKAVEDNAVMLREHMASTYMNLRLGIALIGAALPLLLWIGGFLGGEKSLLGSMSAYYYSHMRDVFVGFLVSIGVMLYLYKGFSTKENWALNLAGALAVGIAMVATAVPGGPRTLESRIHKTFAVMFFLCIAYVAIFRAPDTLSLIHDQAKAARLRKTYRLLGAGMVISPLVAVILSFLHPGSFTFFVEAVAVWIFSTYWLVKSREIRESDAEALALAGKIEASPALERSGAPGRLVRV